MLDAKTMRAIGGLLARQARARAVEADVQADEVISLGPLLEEWQAGTAEEPVTYAAGVVRVRKGIPYRCASRGTFTAVSRAGHQGKRLRCGYPTMLPARSVRCPGNGPQGPTTCTRLGNTWFIRTG